MKPNCIRRDAFTLIELLVSIGIVILLASLAASSIRSATARAQGASCLSQLRQIGSAFLSYTGENNQIGPYDARDVGNQTLSLWRYNGKSVIFGPLMPYLETGDRSTTPSLLICPGASRSLRTSLARSRDNTSYWMNPDVSSNPTNMKSLLSLPGDRVAIMDCCTWWQPGIFGKDYDNHSASGANVFRLNGSASWIPIARTTGLAAWNWSQLDKK